MNFTDMQLEFFKKINMEPTEENYKKLYVFYKKHKAKDLSEEELNKVSGGTEAGQGFEYDPDISYDYPDGYDFDFPNGFFPTDEPWDKSLA